MPALKPQQFVETYIGGVEKLDRDLHKWSICEIQNGSHFLHPADKNGEGKVILKNSKTVIFHIFINVKKNLLSPWPG